MRTITSWSGRHEWSRSEQAGDSVEVTSTTGVSNRDSKPSCRVLHDFPSSWSWPAIWKGAATVRPTGAYKTNERTSQYIRDESCVDFLTGCEESCFILSFYYNLLITPFFFSFSRHSTSSRRRLHSDIFRSNAYYPFLRKIFTVPIIFRRLLFHDFNYLIYDLFPYNRYVLQWFFFCLDDQMVISWEILALVMQTTRRVMWWIAVWTLPLVRSYEDPKARSFETSLRTT